MCVWGSPQTSHYYFLCRENKKLFFIFTGCIKSFRWCAFMQIENERKTGMLTFLIHLNCNFFSTKLFVWQFYSYRKKKQKNFFKNTSYDYWVKLRQINKKWIECEFYRSIKCSWIFYFGEKLPKKESESLN